ncbi:hypothetical protein [Saccharothrix xinjiangensis]|uniref:Uncharacterized protein n=1 Tax=Saccharothrix xinjiangensis TaxID=204798 RepID=A0ABV9Y714_9PSEU
MTADLDAVFARVPAPGVVHGCQACYSEGDLVALAGDPALVPDDLVGAFGRETPDHFDPPEQYDLLVRRLAPRLLRRFEQAPDPMVVRGFANPGFAGWPAEEREAVRAALRDVLGRAVAAGAPAAELEDLVLGAAHAGRDLRPWLAHLDALTGPEADAAVAKLADRWSDFPDPTLWWWPEDPGAPIREWLYSDALHERLTRMGETDTLIAIAEA